jgi:hypothetical protein
MYLSLDNLFRFSRPLFFVFDTMLSSFLTKKMGANLSIVNQAAFGDVGIELFQFVVRFSCGFFLYRFAPRFGQDIVTDDETTQLNWQVGAHDLQRIAFAFVGLILLLQVGPTLSSI